MMDIATGQISYNDQVNYSHNNSTETDISGIPSKNEIDTEVKKYQLTEERPETPKTMMDLKEMTNFLFMLIGSDIQVEPDFRDTGEKINRLA